MVSFGMDPAPVPHELVSQLLLRCDQSGKLMPAKLLKPGDQVRVTRGPFTEIVAEIESLAPDRRVWVLLEIMGGQARVALGADQVRAI